MNSVKFFLICVALARGAQGLNFFTASVDPPDSPYSQLLSGNDVFETVYSTFNSTGLLLLGSALLLSSGFLAIPFLPNPDQFEENLHKFRDGPLGFIPKPGFGKKNKFSGSSSSGGIYTTTTSVTTTTKPVVYSFDLDETNAERNFESSLTQGSNFNLGHVPGPPYKFSSSTPKSKIKHQVYINVDHPSVSSSSTFSEDPQVSQVIEPVVNTITDAIKKSFNGGSNYDYRSSANRRQTNFDFLNEVDPQSNYGYPLDYYDYEGGNGEKKMSYASASPQKYIIDTPSYHMERLRGLKEIYKPPRQRFSGGGKRRHGKAHHRPWNGSNRRARRYF